VLVQVCADDSNRNPDASVVDDLVAAEIPVRLDGKHAIAHSKVIVIDQYLVLTGSYNWSRSADTRNLENLLELQDQRLAEQYRNNFQSHEQHSVPLH
jgi:phosphatidylserine/phosphatidylglycerophosphate/cardiolipin synthase-like enzyme